MTLSGDDFEYIRRMLEEQAGVALQADQDKFVVGRLIPIAQRHGFSHLNAFIAQVRDQNDRLLMRESIESLVTHETSFFRDSHYFDELAEHILPSLIARRAADRCLSIWCAACSTGQEAYSVAMILRERFAQRLTDWKVDLLATDLSAAALQHAQAGCYSEVEVGRGLSDARRSQYFRRSPTGWHIDDQLKQSVRFRQLNLMETWPSSPPVDLVLLRNVLIYMSPTTRRTILTRMQRVLHPEGYLMVGSSETVSVPNLRTRTIARHRP